MEDTPDSDGLEEYVRKSKLAGVSRKELEKALLNAGWKPEYYLGVLNRYFKLEKSGKAIASVPGIRMPPHEYIRPANLMWPPRKIMEAESGETYAKIHPVAQWVTALLLLIILAIYVAAGLFVLSTASQLHIPSSFTLFALIFLPLPYLAASAIGLRYMLETYRFSLQQEFLFVRSGTINPTYTAVPYENVQDAQVAQGFVDRLFGIAHVVVSTPASSVYVSNIALATAQQFREELLTLAKMHKGMAE